MFGRSCCTAWNGIQRTWGWNLIIFRSFSSAYFTARPMRFIEESATGTFPSITRIDSLGFSYRFLSFFFHFNFLLLLFLFHFCVFVKIFPLVIPFFFFFIVFIISVFIYFLDVFLNFYFILIFFTGTVTPPVHFITPISPFDIFFHGLFHGLF